MAKSFRDLRARMSLEAQETAAKKAHAMVMTPLEVLMHLRNAWLQEPQRDLTLTLCPDCRDALLHDLDARFALVEGHVMRDLAHSQVLGFTLGQGTPETCTLHPFLHEKDAICR